MTLTRIWDDLVGLVLVVLNDVVVQVRLVGKEVEAGIERIFEASVRDDSQCGVLGRLLVVGQKR